eukprot:1092763-Amphidinium_carterae.1
MAYLIAIPAPSKLHACGVVAFHPYGASYEKDVAVLIPRIANQWHQTHSSSDYHHCNHLDLASDGHAEVTLNVPHA